jgi:hypothetical protein
MSPTENHHLVNKHNKDNKNSEHTESITKNQNKTTAKKSNHDKKKQMPNKLSESEEETLLEYSSSDKSTHSNYDHLLVCVDFNVYVVVGFV